VFQHQGEATRGLEIAGLTAQAFLADRIVGLAAIAQTVHRLGCQAQVAHDGDAAAHHPVDHGQGFRLGTLQLHRGGRALLQDPACCGHGLVGAALIAQEGQIADQQRVRRRAQGQATGHGPGVVEHVIQGDRQGGGMAKDHHRQGIPYQHRIGTGRGHQGP